MYVAVEIVIFITVMSSLKETQAETKTSVVATASGQALLSPNYPGDYPLDTVCSWVIAAASNKLILLTFLRGRIEECCDSIEVFEDGERVARYSGNNLANQAFLSSTSRITVTFTSDASLAYEGFILMYQAVTCGDLVTVRSGQATPQTFSSPGWPVQYSNDEDCHWIIQADGLKRVELIFRDGFVRENDTIDIYDGNLRISRLNGNINEESFSSITNIMKVNFRSDGRSTGTGFIAEYRKLPCEERFNASSDPTSFNTPAYPFRGYPNDETCVWTIQAQSQQRIVLIFLEGATEDCCDNIQIFNDESRAPSVELSGDVTPGTSFLSAGPRLRVLLISDGSVNGPGFTATAQEVQCGENLPVTAEEQRLDFDGSTGNCVWILNAEDGRQIQFRLTSGRVGTDEVVEIYDGLSRVGMQTGEIEPDVYISTSGILRVVFRGNSDSAGGGFQAEFQENCGRSIVLTSEGPSVSLQSPGWPDDNPASFTCSWIVTSPSFKQVQLSVELHTSPQSGDYLNIYDGRRTIAGLKGDVVNQMYESTGRSFKFTFFTEGLNAGQGFNISAKIAPCESSVLAPYAATELTSPGYPTAYGNEVECDWTIRSDGEGFVEVALLEVQTEECCDFVEILADNRSLGRFFNVTNRITFTSDTGGSLVVRFRSNKEGSGKGFLATYQQRVSLRCGTQLSVRSTDDVTFRSEMEARRDCSVDVTAVGGYQVLLGLTLPAETTTDYVKIYDNSTYIATMEPRAERVTFASTLGRIRLLLSFSGTNGFIIDGFYKRINTRRNVVASDDFATFALSEVTGSDTYPNNLDLRWSVFTYPGRIIEVHILFVETESCCDFLELVEDDQDTVRLSGSHRPLRHTSRGNRIEIRFTTDQSICSGRGFSLRYRQRDS